MSGHLLRLGMALVALCALTGCDGCNKKPDMPVTELGAPAPAMKLAARPAAGVSL